MLKSGGCCLLVFPVVSPVFEAYVKLSTIDKFAQHMTDVSQFITPFYFEDNPLETMRKYLVALSFKIKVLEIRNYDFVYESIEMFTGTK